MKIENRKHKYLSDHNAMKLDICKSMSGSNTLKLKVVN